MRFIHSNIINVCVQLLPFGKIIVWLLMIHNCNITEVRHVCVSTSLCLQENNSPKKDDVTFCSQATASSTPLAPIQVTNNISPQSSCSSSPEDCAPEYVVFRRYTKAAQKLKTGEKFVRCTRCSGPAKLYPEARQAKCTSKSCQYDYCTLCELEFHGASDCVTRRQRKIKSREKPISSKSSKKHLKRL